MLSVAKWLGSGSATTTEEDPAFSGHIEQIAISIPKIELTEISGQEIRSVLGGDDFECHWLLLRMLMERQKASGVPAGEVAP